MKNIARLVWIVALLFGMAIVTRAQTYPKMIGHVNDFTGLLSNEQGTSLESELTTFEKKTGIRIAVVTVSGLNGQTLEGYVKELVRSWNIEKDSQNYGVVFLIAPSERKMRIQTSSAVRATLTDRRTDEVRDRVVLPLFKAGNMSAGIIDGTHAIMRALDVQPSGQIALPLQSTISDKEEVNYSKIILCLVGFFAIIAVFCGIARFVLNYEARAYVLKNKESFAKRLTEVEQVVSESQVTKKTRGWFRSLKRKFHALDRLCADGKKVGWFEIRSRFYALVSELDQILATAHSDIKFAAKAAEEGPKLMREVPQLIRRVQQKFAREGASRRAVSCLRQAESKYQRASGMDMLDWVVLYTLLNDAHSSAAQAESIQSVAHGSSYRSDGESDTSSSSGHTDGGVDTSTFSSSSDSFGGGGGSDGSW